MSSAPVSARHSWSRQSLPRFADLDTWNVATFRLLPDFDLDNMTSFSSTMTLSKVNTPMSSCSLSLPLVLAESVRGCG
ncbi:MAG: hypothetical protein QF416_02905, partial [Candidatus Marinimicrobia bacterium]|nr:hypothetical protein [Candidatus Neomarinimicrobiota bacterium]